VCEKNMHDTGHKHEVCVYAASLCA